MKHKTTLDIEQIPAELKARLDNGETISDGFADNNGKEMPVVIRRERTDYEDGDYEYTYEVYSA